VENVCDVTTAVKAPRISVIIPALNEEKNLSYVFGRLPQVDEVILVDGGSVDDTVTTAARLWPEIRIIPQSRKGKGNALACGFAAATGDIIVALDADGSTDPAEIPLFVAALRGGADFAKGSRFRGNGGSADLTVIRRMGNKVLTSLVNLLFRAGYSDLCYGYNAFWRQHLSVFRLENDGAPAADGDPCWGDGFEIETILNLRAVKAGLHVVEVSSFEKARIHGTSNLNTIKDGARVLWTIAREWPRRHTGPSRVAVQSLAAGQKR
jgi:glycosyltransferase involved in cell wall biosynthesis